MLNVSQDFHKAFQSGLREIFIKIYVNGKLYQKEDINKFECDMGSLSGDTFSVGSTFSNSVKIEFCSIIEGLKELDKVEVEMGIKTYSADNPTALTNPARVGHAKVGKAQLISYRSDEYEFCKLGTFYIKGRVDPDRNENVTSIEAMDAFIYMGGAYESELMYPAKIKDVAIEIANLSGIEVKLETFNSLSNQFINKPIGYTYRQAIGLIAQFQAGFATFNRDGLLDIRTLSDSKYKVTPNEYYQKGLVKNEMAYRVGGISCKITKDSETTILYAGSKNGAQITLENNVMTQSLLDEIYSNVKNVEYYPYSLKWRGNPALEIGEWVTLTDRRGNTFKTPNLSYKLSFSGGLTAQSSADTSSTANATYAYKGPIQQKLEEMDNRIDAAGKNTVYDGLDEPKYPKEGDLWFKPNGPDTEIWVYTKTGDNKYEWVKKTSTALDDEIREQIENSTPSDEIVKTINLSTEMDGKEWLKIEGAKLWLTNETKIDRAIITSAMIADVDAGTINAGILNAGKVNIINLNANNISTGNLVGINVIGSKFVNNFETVDNGATLSGTTTMDGFINTTYHVKDADMQVGEFYLKPYALGSYFYNKDKRMWSWEINNDGFNIANPLYSVNYNTTGVWMTQGNRTANIIKVDATGTYFNTIDNANILYLNNEGLNIYRNTYSNNNITAQSFKSPVFAAANFFGASYVEGGWFTIASDKSANFVGGPYGFKIGIGNASSWSVKMAFWDSGADMYGNLGVNGNLNVSGSKNAIHVTRDGVRSTPAYELAESYLGDIGESKTSNKKEVKIPIETLFNDTVNTIEHSYQVFLQSYGEGHIWVSERNVDYFIIKSDLPNVPFSWEIKAKRRGYELERLSNQDMDNNDIKEIFTDLKKEELESHG